MWNCNPTQCERLLTTIRFSFPTECHQASMCLRHLPRSQPLTCPPKLCSTLSPGVFLNNASHFGPDLVRFRAVFHLPGNVLCGSRGVWGPPNFPAHAISRRGCWRAPRNQSEFMMILCTLGGAARRPRNPAPCVFATRVCCTSTKRMPCRTGKVASPRRILKARRASSTRGAIPRAVPSLIRLPRVRPAPPLSLIPSSPR